MVSGKHAKIKIIIFLTSLAILSYAMKPEMSSSIDCTIDVKQCPNGSYVSRHEPQCEFSPCPEESSEEIEPDASNSSFAIPELILSDEPEFPNHTDK
ncbi:MAG: hypothetical protein KAI76_03960 [Alphaproteobacteria bacterium]|nr:hypothetical protein [Alphaproteobacteria bacterium]